MTPDEPDLSDKETLDELVRGMTDVCASLEELSKIMLDIGRRLARVEHLLEDKS